MPSPTNDSAPVPRPALVDRFGRTHRALRVSVTDACNIRCQYCMPAEEVRFLPRSRLLTFDQIERFVRHAVEYGISKVRITGGEPLLRPKLDLLIGKLTAIAGLDDLALTTNGMLLSDQVEPLVKAGLQRINISLDTLSEATFRTLARRDGLQRVLDGIEAARQFPQLTLKLNTLLLRDINFNDLFDLITFAIERDLPLRFIEFMPLDSDRRWTVNRMISGDELRSRIGERFGPLQRLQGSDPSQPAVEYSCANGRGRLGFIDSVSKPFCNTCDRLRLTADGKIRNCLFSQGELDVSTMLNGADSDKEQIGQVLQASVLAKHASHGIAEPHFQPPERAMYQIGG